MASFSLLDLAKARANNKVIFLDIDGVMCVGEHARRDRQNAFRYFNTRCVKNLKLIIKKVPNVKIVISSTWRATMEHVGIAWERAKLPRNVLIGRTGFHKERIRGHEINEWLAKESYPPKLWVVLDDDSFDIRPHVPPVTFFHTTFKYGLTKPIAQGIIRYFNSK